MFWNKLFNKKPQISINEIINAFKKAVNYNQQLFNNYQIEKLDKLYNADNSPVIKKIQIDNNSFMEVPLITLINHQILSVRELTFTFNVSASNFKKISIEKQSLDMKRNGMTLEYSQNIYDKDKVTVLLSLKK
jgi:hypothetical protein